MTKEEFRKFVKNVVTPIAETQDAETMVVVNQIVAQWESDVNDARIAGQDEGVQSDFGTINTYNGKY